MMYGPLEITEEHGKESKIIRSPPAGIWSHEQMFQARLGTNGKQYMVRVGVTDIQWLQICPLDMFGNKATDGSKLNIGETRVWPLDSRSNLQAWYLMFWQYFC